MKTTLSKKLLEKNGFHIVESNYLENNFTPFSEFILFCMQYIDKKYDNKYAKVYRRNGSFFVTCIVNGKNCKVEHLGIIKTDGTYHLMDISVMNEIHWELFNEICEENNKSIENRTQWFDDMNVDAHLDELRF